VGLFDYNKNLEICAAILLRVPPLEDRDAESRLCEGAPSAMYCMIEETSY